MSPEPVTAEWVWARLGRAVVDRRSPWRTPTLSTVSPDGAPEARTVVLRDAQLHARSLVLHTDVRSAKMASIASCSQVAWTFWNPRQRLQLRARGVASVAQSGAVVDAIWHRLSPQQQATYAVEPGPGTPCDAAHTGHHGRAHFAVVTTTVDHLDLLWLGREGHRRVQLVWNGGFTATDVVP